MIVRPARALASQLLTQKVLGRNFCTCKLRCYSSSMEDYSTRFKGKAISELYAKYRPTYGDEVVEEIINYCTQKGSGFDLAVDVACGNGQSSTPLCAHFQKVIGADVSQTQLEAAATRDNLSYQCARAENLDFLEAESVDLVTVSAGLHWLDRPAFFREVQRVLKPNGVFCGYSYGQGNLSHPQANQHFLKLFLETLLPYWSPARKLVLNKYKDVQLPFSDACRVDSHSIEVTMSMEHLAGYIGSGSAYQLLMKQQPQSTVLRDLLDQVVAAYGEKNPSVTVTWPVFMLLGRRASKQH